MTQDIEILDSEITGQPMNLFSELPGRSQATADVAERASLQPKRSKHIAHSSRL
jgi:hypothetical protein